MTALPTADTYSNFCTHYHEDLQITPQGHLSREEHTNRAPAGEEFL